jgi:hypothetical protein
MFEYEIRDFMSSVGDYPAKTGKLSDLVTFLLDELWVMVFFIKINPPDSLRCFEPMTLLFSTLQARLIYWSLFPLGT